jgi:hypothetical protein
MTREALQYWQRRAGQRPFVLGHRGVRGPSVRVTENTLGAFEAAIEAGADGVELDVRLAKDGAVVVIHDATLTRITQGVHTARVDALSLPELRAVALPGGQRISTLDEPVAAYIASAAVAPARIAASTSFSAIGKASSGSSIGERLACRQADDQHREEHEQAAAAIGPECWFRRGKFRGRFFGLACPKFKAYV